MRKINYPVDSTELILFHTRYRNLFMPALKTDIDNELAKALPYNGITLTFDTLIIMSFEELIAVAKHLSHFISSYNISKVVNGKTIIKNRFNELFSYLRYRPAIATFFMRETDLKIKNCYYCGIDYINSFTDIPDFKDWRDFLNRAKFEELKIITGIGTTMATKIITYRKTNRINAITDITFSKNVTAQLIKFDFIHQHNHFTLDHILPQSQNKFLSLCLYNLVPSCYACNAKFKKAKNFIMDASIGMISPTSANYCLTDDFQFKIMYDIKLKDIKKISDFVLVRDVTRNNDQIDNYAAIFKLDGRYTMHKELVLNLIEKKIYYPKSKVLQIASDLGVSRREVREIIYGKDIFDKNSISPLHKLQRDIAKNIKIMK